MSSLRTTLQEEAENRREKPYKVNDCRYLFKKLTTKFHLEADPEAGLHDLTDRLISEQDSYPTQQ